MKPISSFSLRCGIAFGNSKDEVKRLETRGLFDMNSGNRLSFAGAVSGLPGGVTYYSFNKDDQLIYMSWQQ